MILYFNKIKNSLRFYLGSGGIPSISGKVKVPENLPDNSNINVVPNNSMANKNTSITIKENYVPSATEVMQPLKNDNGFNSKIKC